jgi:hypothetical protein
MKLLILAIIMGCAMCGRANADIASVSYIRDYISQHFCILPPSNAIGTIATYKYLAMTIDWSNLQLNGTPSDYAAAANDHVVSVAFVHKNINDKIQSLGYNANCQSKEIIIYLDPQGGTPVGSISLVYNVGWKNSEGNWISEITTVRTKQGYMWGGFFTQPNCNGVKIMNNDKSLMTGTAALTFTTIDSTVYACWI